MHEQTLQRLVNQATKTAIRIQKCKIYCFLLSTPKIISILILCISIFQVTLTYNDIPIEKFKEALSYFLIVFSILGLILDLISNQKISYTNNRKSYEEIMRIFTSKFMAFNGMLSTSQLDELNSMIDECEKRYNEDDNSYFFISDKYALNRYFKNERSFNWIRDYLSKSK
ncbi:hypothetical protein SLT67_04615 [Paenibacillus illinoisensis]|uniref:hypothetical protein n=1 Tax=Paenibacillus illinoisensis TaxID=59845 RepID=UPI003CEBA989